MMQNWVILVPLIYIVLFIIGAILNLKCNWYLGDSWFGLLTSIVCILCVIWFFIAIFELIDTINGESVMFAQRQAEYKTIVNIFKQQFIILLIVL